VSDAKWHPANNEWGLFGDFGPGHEGTRADRAAGRATGSIQDQYDLVAGREDDIKKYYDLLESLSGEEYQLKGRGVDLARKELVGKTKDLDISRAGVDIQEKALGRKETSVLDSFLDSSRKLSTKEEALERRGRGLVSGEATQAMTEEKIGVQRAAGDSLESIRSQLESLGLSRDKIDLIEDQLTLQGQGYTLRDQMNELSQRKDIAGIGKAETDEITNLKNLLFQLETLAMEYGPGLKNTVDIGYGPGSDDPAANYRITEETVV